VVEVERLEGVVGVETNQSLGKESPGKESPAGRLRR
jgi:hypothetical protein